MDKNNLTIRQASNQDLPEIISLVKNSLVEFDLTYSPETSESDLNDLESVYINNGGCFEIILNENSKVIACAALLKIDEHRAKLRKMYVYKQFRNLGLGKLLIERILEKAIDFGYKEIILETVNTMTSAIRLYEKYDFKRLDNFKADSPRCDIVMIKKLV